MERGNTQSYQYNFLSLRQLFLVTGVFLCITNVSAQVKPDYGKKHYSSEGVLYGYSEHDNEGRTFYEEYYNPQGGLRSVNVYCFDEHGWKTYKFATAFTRGDEQDEDLLRFLVYRKLSDSTQDFRKGMLTVDLPENHTKAEFLKKLYQEDKMQSLMNHESFENLSEACSFLVDDRGIDISNDFYSGVLDLNGQARYVYDYDSNGRIVAEHFMQGEWESQTTFFKYDAHDRIVKQTIMYSYSTEPKTWEYRYDENGSLVEVKESPFYYFVDDEKSNAPMGMSRKVRVEVDFRKEVFTNVWIPNLKAYKTARKEEFYEDEQVGYSEYKYNERGNLISLEISQKDSEIVINSWEYQYFD